MAEIVTGTPAIVGFTEGNRDFYNRGISGKDTMFMQTVEANERTRDVLHELTGINVNVEKNGAANSLATEKIGAAAILAAEKIGAANVLAVWEARSDMKDMAMQLKDCCCELKESIGDVKATVLAVDAGRIRDDLHEARTELLLLRGNGNGNS